LTPPKTFGVAMPSATHSTDVAIIGAGPVGLFTVFELGMLKMRCHVIDALDAAGGQCVALYPEKPIYDIPGYPEIMAGELIARLHRQAAPFEPTYHLDQQVETVTRQGHGWRLETSTSTRIDCRAVVIAAGSGAFGPNRPPLPGIEAYEGRSVHYMVTRRETFRGKRVAIAGGGDSAVDWAISLAELAERIYVIHRRPKFRAAPESVAQMERLAGPDGKVELVVPYQLHGLEGGDGHLDAVVVRTLDGEERRLPADHLLAFFGLSMNLGPIAHWGLDLDHDVSSYPGKLKLILSGFSEAATAAHAIYPLVHPDEALHWEYSTTKGLPGAT
jgi:thioredoxin reductase (NADPH)